MNGLALYALGPQLLAEPAGVEIDQRVGRVEDGCGRTVVLFQAQQLCAGVVLAEALDVLDARAAPAVDGLVVVADDEDRIARAGQQPQPGVLNCIGVLEFVDQHVAEAALVVGEDLGAIAPQFVGAQQQLGEVDHAGALAGLLVGAVDANHLPEVGIATVVEVLGALAVVLARVDEPLHLLGGPLGLVEAHRLEDAADYAILVFGIEDLEGLRQVDVAPMGAQQAVRQTVEGADPHAARRHAEHALDAPAHLGGRLVGEGDREDAERRGAFGADQPCDAMYQHACLAAARPREHQCVAGRHGDGLALRVVQGVEDAGDVHGGHSSRSGCRGGRADILYI